MNAPAKESFEAGSSGRLFNLSNYINHLSINFGGDHLVEKMTTGDIVFDLDLSYENVSQKYTASSRSEFDEAAAYLTNGTNDSISWKLGTDDTNNGGGAGSGLISNEGEIFFGDRISTKGIDFSGYLINNINLLSVRAHK